MLETILWIALFLIAIWIATPFILRGPDLSRYDQPAGIRASVNAEASPENIDAVRMIEDMQRDVHGAPLRDRLQAMRRAFDDGLPGAPPDPAKLGVRAVAVDARGVAGEWVLADNANPDRRLLYIHGGAFAAGSPVSHRPITSRLSRLAGVSVLAIDYRLMPENSRHASIEDCQSAYAWMIDNGPDGTGAADSLFVAGDSAGGNLTLMLIAWIRDRGLRQVNAAIALSPTTDSTLSSASSRSNIETDAMLGPVVGKLARLPQPLILLIVFLAGRIRPTNPLISPVFGNLSRLPPTLVHASECEMLLDDGRRWVNKARAAGTDARLETWPGMLHVWQIFAHILPEANESLERIAAFIGEHSTGKGVGSIFRQEKMDPTPFP